MLARENRLKGQRNFAELAKTGRRFSCGLVAFVFRKINRPGPTKIGLVVSANVSNQATDRNLVKRRLRVIMAEGLSSQQIPNRDYQIMVLARPEIIRHSMNTLRQVIKSCLHVSRFGWSINIRDLSRRTTAGPKKYTRPVFVNLHRLVRNIQNRPYKSMVFGEVGG